MRESTATITSLDGARLHVRDWFPEAAPRGAALIIHGYAEHSGRYDWTARQLVKRGYAVHAFDLRGHGKSDGPRVFIKSMNEYLDDVDAALARAARETPGVPIFLIGHSMGGAVLSLYACARLPHGGPHRDRIAGLVFSGAVLPDKPKLLSSISFGLVERLGRFLPRLRVRSLPAEAVSRDPLIVAEYAADSLNFHGRMPAGLISAMIRGGRYVDRHMHEITLPLLVLHGAADQLTSPDTSRRFFERAGSVDKMLKIYEDLYHEILNEPEQDLVIEDIANWLDRRLAKASASTTVAS